VVSFTGFVIPALLFPSLTVLATKLIFVHSKDPVVSEGLKSQCIPAEGPLALPYTGFDPVDRVLCALVAFFIESFKPRNETFTSYLVAHLAPVVLFSFVEAARNGRPWIISSPMAVLFGLGYQLLTGAVALPLYWLTFIVSGAYKSSGNVDLRHARGTAFGLLVGLTVPSIGMIATHDPAWTALWQAIPLLFWITQRVYLLIQPSTTSSNLSGTPTIRSLYLGLVTVGAIVHLAIVLPNLGNIGLLQRTFVPHIFVVGEPTTVAQAVLNFLQWDLVFIAGAAMLASLWFARNTKEVAMLALWNVLAGLVLGPGAALAAAYAWREGTIGF
jgi:hypothetical protein